MNFSKQSFPITLTWVKDAYDMLLLHKYSDRFWVGWSQEKETHPTSEITKSFSKQIQKMRQLVPETLLIVLQGSKSPCLMT